MKNKNIGKSIVAIIVGMVLYFVLGRYIAISIPGTNEAANIQGSILAVFGIIYGPIVGVLIGFLGQLFIEASWFGVALQSYTWSSIIAAAVFGYLIGLASKTINIGNKRFSGKKIILFNIIQVIANAVAWFVVATILNVLIYKQSLGRQLVQSLITWGINVIIVAIAGTLLLMIYAKTRRKKQSSKKKIKQSVENE